MKGERVMNRKNKSMESCGAIIRHYRTALGMTQAELGERLGTTRNSIINWEQNKSVPDFYTVRQLHELLNIPVEVLLGDAFSGDPSAEMLTTYRKLNPGNQKIIREMVALLDNEQSKSHERMLHDHYLLLSKEMTPSAAGIGYPDMNMPAEPCFVKRNRLSEQADTLITVAGDSMEPKYFDSDLLYVKYTNQCQNGDDAVCVYHEGFILKRYYNHRLYSLNLSRPFGDQHEYDEIKMIGKVIGIVDFERDIPSKEDQLILEKIYADELNRYTPS